MPSINKKPEFGLVRGRRFRVELLDGPDLAAAGWPSIEAGPELLMYVYQSREFLDVWMASIGKARRARCFLVVVRDGGNNPVLYLPLAIETRFGGRILRFMDAGVADFNAPILVAGAELTRGEFLTIWTEIRAVAAGRRSHRSEEDRQRSVRGPQSADLSRVPPLRVERTRGCSWGHGTKMPPATPRFAGCARSCSDSVRD